MAKFGFSPVFTGRFRARPGAKGADNTASAGEKKNPSIRVIGFRGTDNNNGNNDI